MPRLGRTRQHSTVRRPRHGQPRINWWGDQVAEIVEPTINEIDATKRLQARDNLLDYIRYTFPTYKADPFHQHVCAQLQKAVFGEAERIMLFAPPQFGKSEIVSTRLPGFFHAHNPDLPIALVSYAAALADRNSRYAQAVVTSPQFEELFPEIRPDPRNWRVRDWHFLGTKGYVLPVGVDGPVTGHGFGLVIVDDPIENWAAAQSERIRETTWQWYQGTLLTRLWENCRIILMQTRWHKDDVSGRILESEGRIEEGGKWLVLEYPALAEAREDDKPDILGRPYGETLAPSRYSTEWLKSVRDDVGPMVWNAEYQQHPTDPEGDFFKVGRIEIVDAIPAEIGSLFTVPDQVGAMPQAPIPVDLKSGVRMWDLAATEASALSRDPDYTSGQLLAEHEGIWYFLDDSTARYAPEEVEDKVLQTAKLDGTKVAVRVEQEPGSAGKMLVARFVKLLAGYDVEAWPSSGDPLVKATPLAAQINAGNVRLLKAPWNKAWLNEFAGFPHAGHDDRVISASGALSAHALRADRFRKIKFLKV